MPRVSIDVQYIPSASSTTVSSHSHNFSEMGSSFASCKTTATPVCNMRLESPEAVKELIKDAVSDGVSSGIKRTLVTLTCMAGAAYCGWKLWNWIRAAKSRAPALPMPSCDCECHKSEESRCLNTNRIQEEAIIKPAIKTETGWLIDFEDAPEVLPSAPICTKSEIKEVFLRRNVLKRLHQLEAATCLMGSCLIIGGVAFLTRTKS